jgi:hypothetical protein
MSGRSFATQGVTRPWLGDDAWRRALHEQLADELERIRLHLLRHVDWLRRHSGRWPLAGIGTAVVTDEEAIASLAGVDQGAHADFIRGYKRNGAIESLEEALRERSLVMSGNGTPFPIDEMSARLRLDPFVRDSLMLALTPELDPRMARAMAYAQDDASARGATPALALALFSPTDPLARGAAESAFGPYGPFARLALLQSVDAFDQAGVAWPLRVEPRVAWFLRVVPAA